MMDPATGWFEIEETPNKEPETTANIVKLAWLMQCPCPEVATLDRGLEFVTAF